MVLPSRNLELFIGGKEPADLLERLRRNNQVCRGHSTRLDRYLHLGETVPVGRDHPHHVRTQLPQHTVQDRTAFFGGDREGRVRDQLLQLPRPDAPALVELDVRKRGKLIPGKTEEPEMRAAT